MIINTYKTYIATLHNSNTIIARRISASGWAWFTTGRNGRIISPEIPEEHLKNFSKIVQGSMKEGWATETVYEIVCEHSSEENKNGENPDD